MSKASADVLRDARGLTHGSRLRAVICSHGTHSHCNSPELGAPAAPGHPRPWSGEWKEVPVLLRLEGSRNYTGHLQPPQGQLGQQNHRQGKKTIT